MIAVVGRVKSNLRDDIKSGLIPLVQLGQQLGAMIAYRVHTEGIAADGAPWSPYKSKRKPPKRGDRFYWTKPGDPQPALHRITVGSRVSVRGGVRGKYAGRAAYPSYSHWREAMGAPIDRKRFKITGELESSIESVGATPTRVEVAYNKKARAAKYGRAKSGKAYSNQKVAQFAFRSERMSPMQPSRSELEFAAAFVAEKVPQAILKDLRLAEMESRSLGGARRVVGRAERLLAGAGVKVR